MNATLTLKEAAELLHYKDTRSVEKWCWKRGVEIFLEEGSRKKYLISMQFEFARLKKFIEYLKVKFKEKWLDAFQIYMSMNITKVVEIEEGIISETPVNTISYKPQGKQEKNFLVKLQKITPEL